MTQLFTFLAIVMTVLFSDKAFAQNSEQYIRIAKIQVKSEKLAAYTSALKEGIEAAIRKEPGVISLRAVYDKNNPTHVTVFEIYANLEAYQLHIQTPHFVKYKATVADMVLSLELTDVAPIIIADKKKD